MMNMITLIFWLQPSVRRGTGLQTPSGGGTPQDCAQLHQHALAYLRRVVTLGIRAQPERSESPCGRPMGARQ